MHPIDLCFFRSFFSLLFLFSFFSSNQELNGFVIQLDEEVEGMQSTIMTLQQQLKTIKQQLAQQTEQSETLRTKYHNLEQELETTKQAYAKVMSSKNETDSKQAKELVESQSDVLSQMETHRTSPDSNLPNTTNTSSSFSITNILSLDSNPKAEAFNSVSVITTQLENGQEGGDPGDNNVSPTPLDSSDSQPLVTKGIAEGIGNETNAINVSAVN